MLTRRHALLSDEAVLPADVLAANLLAPLTLANVGSGKPWQILLEQDGAATAVAQPVGVTIRVSAGTNTFSVKFGNHQRNLLLPGTSYRLYVVARLTGTQTRPVTVEGDGPNGYPTTGLPQSTLALVPSFSQVLKLDFTTSSSFDPAADNALPNFYLGRPEYEVTFKQVALVPA